MIRFDEAVQLLRSAARPLGTEAVPLDHAAGRVLAEPVVARIDSPRSDVSAMDGYAVRSADLIQFPLQLAIVGESFAGAGSSAVVEPNTCTRIFTGAPVPAGADRVVVQENVRRTGVIATIDIDPGESSHIRTRTSDFASGDELLSSGRLLDARAIVAAAAADVANVRVFRRPRVQILSTGDELAEPGTAHDGQHAIPDSVSLGVAALAEQWGAICVGRSRLRDNFSAMKIGAEAAMRAANVVVVTGGASVGEKDFARAMFEPLGMELIFSTIAMKPGKPVWFGRVLDTLILGLPGNPTSAFVTARLLLVPLIAAMQCRQASDALNWHNALLSSSMPASGDRETFHRATLENDAVRILPFQESHAQKTLAQADVLVRQPAHSPELAAGSRAEILTL